MVSVDMVCLSFCAAAELLKKLILKGHTGAVFKTPNVGYLIQTFILLVS